MGRRAVEKIPLMAGAVRIGELRIDPKRGRQAVEHLAYCAAPLQEQSSGQVRRTLAYVLRAVRGFLDELATNAVEHAVWRSIDGYRGRAHRHPREILFAKRRGRRRKVDPSQLSRDEAELLPFAIKLSEELRSHRNRAVGWEAFVQQQSAEAAILDREGIKAELLSVPKRDLTPKRIMDLILARAYKATPSTIEKRRQQGRRRHPKQSGTNSR